MIRSTIAITCFLLFTGFVRAQSPATEMEPATLQANNDSYAQLSKSGEATASNLKVIAEQLEAIKIQLSPTKNKQSIQEAIDKKTLNIGEVDLVQQTRMAWSTIAMAFVALVSLVLSGIGVAILIKTLRYTKKASEQTRDTLEVARNTMKQNRAYLTPSPNNIELVLNSASLSNPEINMILTWKNTGESPAIKVRIITKQLVVPVPSTQNELDAPIFDGISVVNGRQATLIGKGENIPRPVTLKMEDVIQNALSKKWIIIYTAIAYEDVWGREFFSEWTSKVNFGREVIGAYNNIKKNIPQPINFPFHFSVYGLQNGERDITKERP